MSSLHTLLRPVARQAGIGIWVCGWALMLALSNRLALDTLGMIAVATSVIASLAINLWTSWILATLSTLAFNWLFIPPQGSFLVDLQEHAALLGLVWIISLGMSLLIELQRQYNAWSRRMATRRNAYVHAMKSAMSGRAQSDPWAFVRLLSDCAGAPVILLILKGASETDDDEPPHQYIGAPTFEQQCVMWIVLRVGQAYGPATGQNESLDCWYIPIHGQSGPIGVAMIPLSVLGPQALLSMELADYTKLLHAFGEMPR